MMLSVPRWENPWVVVAFLIFTGSAFGMNLLVILIATLACLWGPGKALRGDEPSHLHDASPEMGASKGLLGSAALVGAGVTSADAFLTPGAPSQPLAPSALRGATQTTAEATSSRLFAYP